MYKYTSYNVCNNACFTIVDYKINYLKNYIPKTSMESQYESILFSYIRFGRFPAENKNKIEIIIRPRRNNTNYARAIEC